MTCSHTQLRILLSQKFFSVTWAACCWLLSILLLSFVKAEKQIRCVFNWFFTLFSFLFLLILLTFSIPESRYVIPVQVLQIDYNRALEGPPGSKNLLSPSLREYLSRVSELCQCYFGQYYKINKISFIEVLKSTVLVEHQTFHCIYTKFD